MTDFFNDLEAELRAAHRRDAQRPLLARLRPPLPRPRVVLAVAGVAAALVAIVLAAPGVIDRIADEDAPLPAAAPVSCQDSDPPQAVLDTFAIFRRPKTQADEVPGKELAAWLAEGDAAKLWPERLRLARGEGGFGQMLIPALMGDCGGDLTPGVCLIESREGEVESPTCLPLDAIRTGTAAVVTERGGVSDSIGAAPQESVGRTSVLAIVPDGSTPVLDVEGRVVTGSTEGNVFAASYTPRSSNEAPAAVLLGGPEKAGADCARGPTSEPVPDELSRILGALNTPKTSEDEIDIAGLAAGGYAWRDVFDQGPYIAGVRLAFERYRRQYWLVPVKQAKSVRCEFAGEEPPPPVLGACAVASEPGREEEAFAVCSPLDDMIPAGNLGSAHSVGEFEDGTMETLAVVLNGFDKATFRRGDLVQTFAVEGNVVAVRLKDGPTGLEVTLEGIAGTHRVR